MIDDDYNFAHNSASICCSNFCLASIVCWHLPNMHTYVVDVGLPNVFLALSSRMTAVVDSAGWDSIVEFSAASSVIGVSVVMIWFCFLKVFQRFHLFLFLQWFSILGLLLLRRRRNRCWRMSTICCCCPLDEMDCCCCNRATRRDSKRTMASSSWPAASSDDLYPGWNLTIRSANWCHWMMKKTDDVCWPAEIWRPTSSIESMRLQSTPCFVFFK